MKLVERVEMSQEVVRVEIKIGKLSAKGRNEACRVVAL